MNFRCRLDRLARSDAEKMGRRGRVRGPYGEVLGGQDGSSNYRNDVSGYPAGSWCCRKRDGADWGWLGGCGWVAGSIWDASDGIRGMAASIGQRRACRGLLGHRQEGYAAPKRNEYKQPYDQQPMISIKMLKIRNYCTRASPPGPLIGF